jgi:ribosomal protein L37E
LDKEGKPMKCEKCGKEGTDVKTVYLWGKGGWQIEKTVPVCRDCGKKFVHKKSA